MAKEIAKKTTERSYRAASQCSGKRSTTCIFWTTMLYDCHCVSG